MTRRTTDKVAVAAVIVGLGAYFDSLGASIPGFAIKLGITNSILLRKFGLSMILLGAFLSSSVVVEIVRGFHAKFRRHKRLSPIREVVCATREDLLELHEFLVQHFRDEAPEYRQMVRWHSVNAHIFYIAVEWDAITGQRRMVGAFKLVPLKKNAIAYLEFKKYTGANLPESEIAKVRGYTSAFYIGDVIGVNRHVSELVMAELIKQLRACVRVDTPIFARGLSDFGLGYLVDFHFTPVGDDEVIDFGTMCALYPPYLGDFVQRLRSGKPLRPNRRRRAATLLEAAPALLSEAGQEEFELSLQHA